MKEAAKLCANVCRKCNRCLWIQRFCVDTQRFTFFDEKKKPNSMHKCVRLICCNVRRNAINNALCGISTYTLKEWDFDYSQFKEADRLYYLLSRYSRIGKPYEIECLDFSKFENATDEVKKLLSGVTVHEWQCPYYIEHLMSEWNKK